MWIQPNTTVKILKQVPLDDTYENTLYFSTASAQATTFALYTKYTLQNPPSALTYQRVNKNSIRINRIADDLYDCNYIMFQNSAYGTKWFYAFITQVNYVNDNVTEIVYQIDDLQTWWFDFTLEECFVEREHSASDGIGENLLPESLPTGEICYAGRDELLWYDYLSNSGTIGTTTPDPLIPCLVIAAPFGLVGEDKNGQTAGGLYSGLNYIILYSDPVTQNYHYTLNEKLTIFFNQVRSTARADEIVTMFYFFKKFAQGNDSNVEVYQIGESGGHLEVTVGKPNPNYSSYDLSYTKDYTGFKNDYAKTDAEDAPYTPKNNKLYTAPYNFITITDWQGHSQDLAYEYFASNDYKINVRGTISTQPSIAFTPVGYMGSSTHTTINNAESVTLNPNFDYTFWFSDFPKVPWTTDGFIAWLAQTGVAIAGATAGGLGMGLLSGGLSSLVYNENASLYNTMLTTGMQSRILSHKSATPQGSAAYMKSMSGLTESMKMPENSNAFDFTELPNVGGMVKGVMASGAVAALRGNVTHGTSVPSANWGINNIHVTSVHKKIRKDYAKMIDEYFTMYGYSTMKVKIPNTMVRTEFTYTKTVGCTIVGSLPVDSARKICDIFDHGIRFWVNHAHVGKYHDYDNNVLT